MAEPLREQLRDAMLAIDGVEESDSIFDERAMAFFVNGKQMAEWGREPNTLYVRLTWPIVRENKERLKADGRVRPWKSGADWVMLELARAADVEFAADLVRLAADQYRPGAGEPLRPPPQGADLARRRRFH